MIIYMLKYNLHYCLMVYGLVVENLLTLHVRFIIITIIVICNQHFFLSIHLENKNLNVMLSLWIF